MQKRKNTTAVHGMNYSDVELTRLLDDLESDLAERKESWNGDAPEKGRQAVCAFANDLPDHRKPGVLFVGVNNAGVPTGIAITDELLQTLSDIKTDGNTLPPPIIDEVLIDGDLEHVVQRIDEKMESHNRVSIDIVTNRVEQRQYLYPVPALQQLVRNAIMHRTYENTNAPVHVYWYDDRIEIRSPGGPYGAVNTENFGKPGVVDYRNPRIADAMKVLGLVQRFGLGIQTAQAEMQRNGNPPIVFKTEHSAVVCILHPLSMPPVLHNEQANEQVNEQVISGLSQLQIKLLEEIRRNPGVSYEELVPIVNLSRATIVRTFSKLKQSGILKRIGPDKTGKWVVVKKVKT